MIRPTRRRFALACGVAATGGAGAIADLVRPVRGEARPNEPNDESTPFEATWEASPSMPDERTEVRAAVLDGRLYVFGGFVPEEDAADPADPVTDAVAVYDPDELEWDYAAPMPEPLHHVSVAVHDDRIYVLGGHEGVDFEAVDSVLIFDGEEWSTGEPMPTARGALTAGTIGDRIYVAGGVTGAGTLTALEAYDPAADEWAELAAMPTPRKHLASAVLEDELYVVGGRVAFGENLTVTEAYDPAADEWDQRAPIPTARSGHDARTVDGRLVAVGGESPERTIAETAGYDPAADEWTALEPIPTPRHGLGAAVIDGDLYVASGGPEPGFTYSDALDVLAIAGA